MNSCNEDLRWQRRLIGDGKFALRLLTVVLLKSRGDVIARGNYSWEMRGSTSLAAVKFVLGVKKKLGRMEPDHWASHVPGENA